MIKTKVYDDGTSARYYDPPSEGTPATFWWRQTCRMHDPIAFNAWWWEYNATQVAQ